MTAGDLALILAATLCAIGFAALVVVLSRVLSTLGALRDEIDALQRRTTPLLDELRESTDDARHAVLEAQRDLERFDRVLGSAEAISGAVSGTGRVARRTFSRPVIKVVAFGAGFRRAFRRLRRVSASSNRTELRVVQNQGRKRA